MGNRSRTPLALGALVLALCAVVAGSGEGLRWAGLERQSPAVESVDEGGDEAADPGGDAPTEKSEGEKSSAKPDRVGWWPSERMLLLALLAVLVAIIVAVLSQLRLVVRRRQLRGDRWRTPVRVPVASGVPEEDDGSLADAIDGGLEELGAGAPRNAIVAAWLRLERAAESERFRRDPADTPSEFAERVLSSYSLDGGTIGRLAALYREARFSEHPISESQREEARACLAALLADLRASTAGREGP